VTVVGFGAGNFDRLFETLTPQEQVAALGCVLMAVTVLHEKLVLDVFEPAELPGSQNRSECLPKLDDVRTAALKAL
jgi:hypothetical protein